MTISRRQVLYGGLGLGVAAGATACAGLTGKKDSTNPTPAAGGGTGGGGNSDVTTLTFVN